MNNVETIKALSIRQPWGYLIANPELLAQCGIPAKNVENRDWYTPVRGAILLHAGKLVDERMFINWKIRSDYFVQKFGERGARLVELMPQGRLDYPVGAIVGTAKLIDVVQRAPHNPWFVGRYGFVLSQAREIRPVAYRGQLGFFDVPVSAISDLGIRGGK